MRMGFIFSKKSKEEMSNQLGMSKKDLNELIEEFDEWLAEFHEKSEKGFPDQKAVMIQQIVKDRLDRYSQGRIPFRR